MSTNVTLHDDTGGDLVDQFGDLERRLWYAFFQMDGALWQRLTKQLKRDTGLSEADFRVLVTLLNAEPKPLRAFELAQRIDFDKARLHRHLERMEHRGMIQRRRADDDARGVWVSLSPTGREAIVTARPLRGLHIRESMVDALSGRQLLSFVEASEVILEHLRGIEDTDPNDLRTDSPQEVGQE